MTMACRSPECAVRCASSSEALDAGCTGTRLDAPTSAAFRSVVTLLISPLIFVRDSRRQGSFCVWFTPVLNLNSSRNTPLIQPQHSPCPPALALTSSFPTVNFLDFARFTDGTARLSWDRTQDACDPPPAEA